MEWIKWKVIELLIEHRVLAVVPVDFVSDTIAASQLAPYFDSRIILTILRGQ